LWKVRIARVNGPVSGRLVMDPVVIIIVLATLAGGGATGVAVATYRRRRREAMGESLERKRDHGESPKSLFDVFWDLGASDLALEMMRHEGLLPEEPDEGERAHGRLRELVEAHGDYPTYVRETLEVIEEFEEQRKRGESRRNVPALETRTRKLLEVGGNSSARESLEVGALVERGSASGGTGRSRGAGEAVAASFERRVDVRRSGASSEFRLHQDPEGGGGLLDVDDFEGMSAEEMLGSVFEGRFTETLRDWWERRAVRSLKRDLDEAFERLYDFYVAEVERRPDFYDDLFATAEEWGGEVERLEALRDRAPLAGEPTELAADVLVELALETSRSIVRDVESSTRQAIERIHAYAARGDFAMAGYLVYLNRNAFFAGRSEEYGSYVRRIENLAHRLRREVRRLE